jgi:hypothetical protein
MVSNDSTLAYFFIWLFNEMYFTGLDHSCGDLAILWFVITADLLCKYCVGHCPHKRYGRVFNNRALYSEGHGFKSRLGKGLF